MRDMTTMKCRKFKINKDDSSEQCRLLAKKAECLATKPSGGKPTTEERQKSNSSNNGYQRAQHLLSSVNTILLTLTLVFACASFTSSRHQN
ncbi:hypothetical protein J6590_033011 [Homalodisca vitripennis]|nr:hypothetical protein J6590_033011 [Homalodisca vitripennis]